MINTRIILLVTVILSTFTFLSKSQVTMGMDTITARAALLQLKTNEASNPSSVTADQNITSQKGGLLLPRVKLTNRNTMEPFISGSDVEWLSNSTKIREKHAGLMVYNLTANTDFKQGLYAWDGSKWENKAANYALKSSNGLTTVGEEVQLGGFLTNSATEIDLNNSSLTVKGTVEFDISSPLTLESTFNYASGAGKGKILTSDANGNASWQLAGTFSETPSAVFEESKSETKGNLDVTESKDFNKKTGLSIVLPPGRWFIAVAMLVKLSIKQNYNRAELPGRTEKFSVVSTFIEDGKTAPDKQNFENGNMYVSGVAGFNFNIVDGFVIINNTSSVPKKFNYCLVKFTFLNKMTDAFATLIDFGNNNAWGENSIVAFSLR